MSRVPFPRQAYYERIGAAQSLLPLLAPQAATATATMSFLKQLILSHTSSIPFETLDVLLGRRVSIAPADIYDKLIHAGRGGYCFEQNTLFHEALRDAGFTNIRQVAARVLWDGENSPLGRTHMLNIVTLPEKEGEKPQQWMLDVGFGAGVPRAPLLLTSAEPQKTIAGVLRVRTRNACPDITGEWTEYVVDLQVGDTWRSMYHFDLQPQKARDFYMMNYVIYNESLFQGSLQASRPEGSWVKATTDTTNEATTHAVVSDTGYTYVPRGMHSAVADTICRATARGAFLMPDVCQALLPAVGGLVPAAQSHFATPGELYDWIIHTLRSDLAQTRVPQHHVSRAEFEKAARERLVVFGGKGFTPPHHL